MTANNILGTRALVIGAGAGGILAAGALSRHFSEVVVIEKDVFPSEATFRKGVPQGPHGHLLLKRGENISEAFFPGFRDALISAGGIELGMDKDMARYSFGKWSKPVRSDIMLLSQTRPLFEQVLRESLLKTPNVSIKTQTRFSDFIFESGAVQGIVVEGSDGALERLEADLVIDASGRATKTPRWLEDNGFGAVQTDRLGIDLCYVTGVFAAKDFEDGRPKLSAIGETPPAVRGGVALPVEGNRWMVTLSGRGDDVPSTDLEQFLAFAKALPDPVVYDRIANAPLEGNLRRFKIPESFWRRYESLPQFPDGLLPLGDAIAGFNPVFGQGMAVAAVDAEQLAEVLEARTTANGGLTELHKDYLPKVSKVIQEAWEGTATFDLLYEATKGVRPEDYPQRRAIFLAIQDLSDDDEDLRRKLFEVGNMLIPRESLFDADLVARIRERVEDSFTS